MGKYNGAVITNAGEQLLASALAGSVELMWTVMRTSTAVVSTSSIKAMTSLTGVQQTASITRASVGHPDCRNDCGHPGYYARI